MNKRTNYALLGLSLLAACSSSNGDPAADKGPSDASANETGSESPPGTDAAPGGNGTQPDASSDSGANAACIPSGSADTLNAQTSPCSPFDPASPWNVHATGEVDSTSATRVSSSSTGSLAQAFQDKGHGFDIQGTDDYPDYGVPIYYADSTTPSRPVKANSDQWWPGFPAVPFPSQAKPSAGSDHHLAIWDISKNKLWEFWDLEQGSNGSWTAGLAASFDAVGTGYQTTNGAGSARAYGGSLAAGAIRYQEIASGSIHHALAMAYPGTLGKQYARGIGKDGVTQNIASHSDNDGSSDRNGAGNIPEGARLRLKASVGVDAKCGSNRACKIIGHAMQDFGIYVVDNAAVSTLYAEVLTGKSVSWTNVLTAQDARAFAAADFELLSLPANLSSLP